MPLPFDKSKPGIWVSAGVHVGLVLVALFAVASDKMPDADEGIPVEVVTDDQLAEMTRGEKTAASVQPNAKPRADRVADTKQERDPGDAKQDAPAPPKRPVELKTAEVETAAPPPPPPPVLRLADAKPEPVVTPPPPPPPTRPEPPKADAKAEAAKAEAARADAASKADAAKAAALKVAEAREAEAIENARQEAAEKAADAKARADARAKSEADTRVKAAAAKAKSDAEAKAELDSKMKAMATAEAKAEADSKARAQAVADAKAKAVADAAAKAEADAKAKTKALAAAKAKADAEAKALRQAEAADKFSPGAISQMLASKAPSQSTGSTGADVQRTSSLGAPTATGQRLNPSMRGQIIGILTEQLLRCWQVPVAARGTDKPPIATVRVQLKPDGTLAAEPIVVNSGDGLFRTVAESATRATRRCAPYKLPSQFAPYYQDWKDLVVNFDPRDVG